MASDEPVDRRGELAWFARDAALDLDARVVGIRPDFTAMMERARTLAAEAAARPPAPVIPLVAGLAGDNPAAPPDLARQADPLVPFTAALRGELDAKAQRRVLAGVPPPRTSARTRAPAVHFALAAAAALSLTVSGAQVLRVLRDDRGVEANAAVDPRTDTTSLQTPARSTEPHTPRLSPSVPGDSADAGELAPEGPAAQAPVPGDSLPVDPRASPKQPGPGHAPAARTPRAAPTNRQRAAPTEPPGPTLEDEAQRLWERGELAAAERKFREVLRLAGDSRRAELAYGDLFVLARQMRGADGQTSVWREYLERFPRGRFAEDARGGLCRRATGDERTACWRAYLTHHPDGTHREQATAAMVGAP